MQASQLRAGVAETELQPALGLALGDGLPWAKGYKMPLACKALVLANAEDAIALVTLDALGIDLEDARRAAALAAERTRVPASGVGATRRASRATWRVRCARGMPRWATRLRRSLRRLTTSVGATAISGHRRGSRSRSTRPLPLTEGTIA